MRLSENVFLVARELILEVKDIEEHEITPQTRIDALELDSLDFVEMQVVIKKKFGVALDPAVFASGQVTTLQQMCDHIAGLVDRPAQTVDADADAVPA